MPVVCGSQVKSNDACHVTNTTPKKSPSCKYCIQRSRTCSCKGECIWPVYAGINLTAIKHFHCFYASLHPHENTRRLSARMLEANANATCWLLTVLRVKRPMTGWEAGKAWDIWQTAWQAAWQAHRRKCLVAAQWCSQEHPDIPPRSASLPASAAQEKARSDAPGLRCRKLLGLHGIGSPKVRFEFLGSSESVNRVQHLCVLRN